jgi:hypothetical protein
MEDKECTGDDARKADAVIPAEFFAEIKDGKHGEHRQSDHFLDGFELRAVEFVGSDAVCGHLKAVFEKSNAPAGDDDLPERSTTEFQMTVPGKGHKDVGKGEEKNGAQGRAPLRTATMDEML